jgi:F0F1-type ATP synthase assembly protein I
VGSWVGPAAYLLEIGWFFAISVIAGVAAGWWLDSETGLEPTFTLIGVVLGLAVAFYGCYRILRQFLRRYGGEPPRRGSS